MVPVVLYKLSEREAIKMDTNSTKRPMAQRTMLAFIKKKRTDEENFLEMTAATNSNVESSMVSAASNVQSRTNVESLVDRNVDVHIGQFGVLSDLVSYRVTIKLLEKSFLLKIHLFIFLLKNVFF